MFRPSMAKGFAVRFKNKLVSYCAEDGADAETEGLSIIEQADADIENEKMKIRTPMQFENLKGTLNQGTVNTYDGCRVIVQKQINLNTVVSHFYWLGSQVTGQPIYQYRLILPFDDNKIVNVATDMDFNVEGEAKASITDNVSVKTNFTVGDQQNSLSVDLELQDESSATQFQYALQGSSMLSLSYMQCVTPFLTLGGMGQYSLKDKSFNTALGGILENGENTLAAQWDKSQLRVLYLRKVNPNRVHLTSDLLVDESGNSQMTLGAEFMLKQSKLHMSVDSNLMLKSMLEAGIAPNMQMQLAAEMMQLKNHYRFGCGIVMG